MSSFSMSSSFKTKVDNIIFFRKSKLLVNIFNVICTKLLIKYVTISVVMAPILKNLNEELIGR